MGPTCTFGRNPLPRGKAIVGQKVRFDELKNIVRTYLIVQLA
jgi:hypothetical protein